MKHPRLPGTCNQKIIFIIANSLSPTGTTRAYNKIYDYRYTFNADGYVTESKQYDSVTGGLLWTIAYELIKP